MNMRYPIAGLLSLLLISLLSACGSDADYRTTPGGYKYVVHIENGGETPSFGDIVYYRSIIRTEDTVFYQTGKSNLIERARIPEADDPGVKRMNHVLDALMQMSKGDSVTLYFPMDSMEYVPPAYKNVKQLIYELAMIDFESEEKTVREQVKRMDPVRESTVAFFQEYVRGELDDELSTTDSGIKYLIHNEGSGLKPNEGQKVFIDFLALDLSGRAFDNSYQRSVPFFVRWGDPRLLPGWTEALSLLSKGGDGTFIIPAQLAYGATGNKTLGVPENMDILVYFEMVDIKE